MEKIYSENDLNMAILHLESKQFDEELRLKEQFHLTYESLKPINIIKNIFKETTESQEIKENIINNSIGLTAGYLSKIAFEKVASNPFKRLFGNIVMFSVKKVVSNNLELIKLIVNKFLK